VRSGAPNMMVMFNCIGGDSSMAAADLEILADHDDLVFTMYDYYGGGAGDGYLANGAPDSRATGGLGYITADGTSGYPNADPAELEEHLLVNVEIMREAKIPVWIGASGISLDAVNARRWIRHKVALFRAYDLGYAWWLHGRNGRFATMTPKGKLKGFVRLLR
jgi:hypothetical protein